MTIERDKNGFITEKQRTRMFNLLPIVVRRDGCDWELITEQNWLDWQSELEKVEYVEYGVVTIRTK